MKIYSKIILLFIFFNSLSFASLYVSRADSVRAVRLSNPIKLDGKLEEPVWQNGYGISNFIQRDPKEGAKPTEKTVVHIAYDDDAIYIGAQMYDSNPDSIVARLGRKDADMESDAFILFIDPYNDKRSGFYFALNAAGTYYDGVLMNDEWDDNVWDGVWEGKVNIDEQGWTAEMRIPYSQLRFHKMEKYVWGINFRRDITRKNERDYLVFTPKDGSGFVSRFPSLIGIEKINPTNNIEILPYFRTKAEYLQHDAGDPFNDGSRYRPGLGADLKIGLSSNLVLDATINPDFGQVEVDPAVVNLSDVETFFSEKRPFFIEGANIFWFGQGGSRSNWGFNWSNPDFFYSRRIGRAPEGSLPDYDYADIPDGTSILGAGKITGKIGGNWNVGMVHALTNREYADLELNGKKSEKEVEPMSYFGIARAQKEFDEGRQGLGFISTFTNRFFKDQRLEDEYNSSATTFGIDGWTFLDQDQEWVLTAWSGISHLRGTEQRMIDMQRSSRHYLQRPDAKNFSVDSSARSMTGYAGRVLVNKQKGNVIFNSAFGVIDPRFDLNDMGWLWRSDVINGHLGGGYKWVKPTNWYRSINIIGALFGSLDFDYNVTWAGVFLLSEIELLNYYNIEIVYAYNPETTNNRRTRGGPLTKNLSGWETNVWLQTDERKAWVFELGTWGYYTNSNDWSRGLELSAEWKPAANLSISFSPEIQFEKENTQWIDVFDDPLQTKTFGKRYVFGELDYTELAASIRVNWTFTPRMSFQLYVQPLFSTGNYKNFKELAKANSYDFNVFGDGVSTINFDGETYTADPDGNLGPANSINFENPDFNFKSIRANAVWRWEYLPGSTLYLVWTQSRSDFEDDGVFRFRRDIDRIWNSASDNIFMVKLTYYLNI